MFQVFSLANHIILLVSTTLDIRSKNISLCHLRCPFVGTELSMTNMFVTAKGEILKLLNIFIGSPKNFILFVFKIPRYY